MKAYQMHLLNMRTRMPFRFGISTMTHTPHLFLSTDFLIDGEPHRGVAADHLPPKWFTKNPSTPLRDEVDEMIRVIRHAANAAKEMQAAESPYAFWKELYARQAAWIEQSQLPPLLGFFGVTLVERAMLDAFCRAIQTPFADALRGGKLGMDDLALNTLPPAPLHTLICRHTVGLTDPIAPADIPEAERLDDGLPQSLIECIRAYGLTHFKIKLCGDGEKDLQRLRRLRNVLESESPNYQFTLDGNENFHDLESFAALWKSLAGDPALEGFLKRLIFVEQPMHRSVALSDAVGAAMNRWTDRPPIIIDESDATLDSLPTAIRCGYVGTSHKNCKGVFKGILNAGRIAALRRSRSETHWIQSGEDLSNVGPISLLQDLAVMANLGISHVERNGHHYFRGLSYLTPELQNTVLEYHPDVYRRHERGYATLNVERGKIAVGSVIAAPFGAGFDFDASEFTPLDQWSFESI
jgi:L-alanine-DL-glutamate epimerase-like enolase superfamily enzyme